MDTKVTLTAHIDQRCSLGPRKRL